MKLMSYSIVEGDKLGANPTLQDRKTAFRENKKRRIS